MLKCYCCERPIGDALNTEIAPFALELIWFKGSYFPDRYACRLYRLNASSKSYVLVENRNSNVKFKHKGETAVIYPHLWKYNVKLKQRNTFQFLVPLCEDCHDHYLVDIDRSGDPLYALRRTRILAIRGEYAGWH